MHISKRQRKNLQSQVLQRKRSKKREGGALRSAAPRGLGRPAWERVRGPEAGSSLPEVSQAQGSMKAMSVSILSKVIPTTIVSEQI